MKTLTALYQGEFGWELMCWQGFLRRAAKGYDEVIISAPEGHEVLYADFATTYIPHTITGVKDCHRCAISSGKDQLNIIKKMFKRYGGDEIVPPGFIPLKSQDFIPFGKTKGEKFDVVVHARHPIGKYPKHSWDPDKWDILLRMLLQHGLSVAAVGTESYLPFEAVDRRYIPLPTLMSLFRSCRLVTGPSSGPMHLASLCQAKHLVWTDDKVYGMIKGTNRTRYTTLWNPLQTPCMVLDSHGWDPEPEVVFSAILEALK